MYLNVIHLNEAALQPQYYWYCDLLSQIIFNGYFIWIKDVSPTMHCKYAG